MTAWDAFGRLLDHTIDVKKKKKEKEPIFVVKDLKERRGER